MVVDVNLLPRKGNELSSPSLGPSFGNEWIDGPLEMNGNAPFNENANLLDLKKVEMGQQGPHSALSLAVVVVFSCARCCLHLVLRLVRLLLSLPTTWFLGMRGMSQRFPCSRLKFLARSHVLPDRRTHRICAGAAPVSPSILTAPLPWCPRQILARLLAKAQRPVRRRPPPTVRPTTGSAK